MALTVKWIREQRHDTVKLKIWNHQKRQRENHKELQDNRAANQTNNEIRPGRHKGVKLNNRLSNLYVIVSIRSG